MMLSARLMDCSNDKNVDNESRIVSNEELGTEYQSSESQSRSGQTSGSSNSLRDELNRYIAPKLGSEFESEEHAYYCYNRYAVVQGFSVRKDFINRNRVSGIVVSRRYACYKQGFNSRKSNENSKKPRMETRTGCLAHITISRLPNSGRYKVTSFENEHNHDLATPFTAHLLPSQKIVAITEAIEAELTNGFVNDGVPKLGMGFESEDSAYCFYNEYAAKLGFSVRKDCVNRSIIDGGISSRKFTCVREGYRRNLDAKKPKKQKRIGCLARLVISRQSDGRYRVTHFQENHNHDLGPECKVSSSLSLNLDNRHRLSSKRTREVKDGDCETILEHIQRKQSKDSSFFHAFQYDIEDQLTNVFWADGKMRLDYGDFSDVVCLYTTPRSNKESQLEPLVFFAGVNKHKQIIIFGAALLYDETTDSFKWLFRMFNEAMSMKKPNTILTDLDDIITVAINQELPDTVHRLCSWQIYQNALERLSKEIASFESLAIDLKSCIFHHGEEEHFVNAWRMMLEMYNLSENEFLLQVFKDRQKWALPYNRYTFFAGIQSAQLDESININMRKYFRSELNVFTVFKNFKKMLNDSRYKEVEANYSMSQNTPDIIGDIVMLKHARNVYTPKIFECFQQEYENCLSFIVNRCFENETMIEFKLSVYGEPQKESTVMYNLIEDSVICECMKFESFGILCSHILKILDYRNIKIVPSKYILNRWCKDARVFDKLA